MKSVTATDHSPISRTPSQTEVGVSKAAPSDVKPQDTRAFSDLELATLALDRARTEVASLQRPLPAWRRHIKTAAKFGMGASLALLALGLMIPPLLPFAGLVGASYWTVIAGLFLLAAGIDLMARQVDQQRTEAVNAANAKLVAADRLVLSLKASKVGTTLGDALSRPAAAAAA